MDDKITKRIYEVSFLVRDENGAASLVKHIMDSGGEVSNEGDLRQIQLAYPIKKEESAYFGCIQSKLPENSIESITNSLVLDNDILRFLIVRPTISRDDSEKRVRKEDRPVEKKRSETPKVSKPQPDAALSNELLEEKLEEILK